MNLNLHFSVYSDALNGIPSILAEKNPENRYHFSHAVWQLARMGAYNATGEIPLAVRLERNGEIGELYADHERYIALIDTSETDPADPALLGEILLGFAVRLATSTSSDSLSFHIVCSSKAIESVSTSLTDWKNHSDLLAVLTSQIDEHRPGMNLQESIVSGELARDVIARTTIEYQRRRQGRLGDESLWGRELDGLKVLQDAGIAGNDLGPALKSLIRTVSTAASSVTRKQLIDRQAAFLMIRDFQRRARMAISSVRMIDERFISEDASPHVSMPRCPSWRQAGVDRIPGLIPRSDLDACVKWARRAAGISGRGLLPIFLFNGESGNGTSLILRETALQLYRQGYTIAEILDIESAANDAEHLANAAMAGDSPLILVWDDCLGLGQDPIASFREIASAQISGAPIVILAAFPDTGISMKQLKKIQHTVVEEFTVHAPTVDELGNLKIDSFPEHSSFFDAWLIGHRSTSLSSLAADLAFDLDTAGPDIGMLHRTVLAMGILGLSTPMKLLENLSTPETLAAALKMVSRSGEHLIRSTPAQYSDCDDPVCDFGHIRMARAVWEALKTDDSTILSLYDRIVTMLFETIRLQNWTPRFLRVLNGSTILPSEIKAELLGKTAQIHETTPDISGTRVLADLLVLVNDDIKDDRLSLLLTDLLSARVRASAVDSFIALPVLLRNNLGALENTEKLKALCAARPSLDRIGFKFLTRYLGDHIPGELGYQAVDDARTAAARDPDDGHAIAAYLRLVSQRGSDEQTARAENETRTWLEINPEDRIVRRAFVDFTLRKGTPELKKQVFEQTTAWLDTHLDEGPLRKGFIDLAIALEDTKILDAALEITANWIEKRGNNRWVRKTYLDQVRQRGHRETTLRAATAILAWVRNNRDDRDAIRALLSMALKLETPRLTADVLSLAHTWLVNHLHDPDLMRTYLILVDRAGEGKSVSDAVEHLDAFVSQNPEDRDARESLLSLAAKNIDKKLQQKVYDRQSQWLEQQPVVDKTMEYMIGRLGVRAGIARRAIPLLERAVGRDDSDLREHALLWLGSAYRISGEYIDARATWRKVMESTDEKMKEKATRNLESLESFMDRKYPNGYPPPEDRPARPPRKPRSPHAEQPVRTAVSDDTQPLPIPTQEMLESRPRPPRVERQTRPVRPSGDAPYKDRPSGDTRYRDRPSGDTRYRDRPSDDARSKDRPSESRPRSDRPSRHDRGPGSGDGRRHPGGPAGHAPAAGATLGDLLKLKGMNLLAELEKSAREAKDKNSGKK